MQVEVEYLRIQSPAPGAPRVTNEKAADGRPILVPPEYKLEVWDSPNSAGVIIDAVRAAKIALDRGIGGPILSASSYFMKSPPVQHNDDAAHELVEAFIRGDIER